MSFEFLPDGEIISKGGVVTPGGTHVVSTVDGVKFAALIAKDGATVTEIENKGFVADSAARLAIPDVIAGNRVFQQDNGLWYYAVADGGPWEVEDRMSVFKGLPAPAVSEDEQVHYDLTSQKIYQYDTVTGWVQVDLGGVPSTGVDTLDELVDKTTGSDIEIVNAASGVILRSPGGFRFRVQVDNSGQLTATSI